jgi:hypothetical protein
LPPLSLIVTDNNLLVVRALASCTCTVKLEVPAVVGVPEITPVELARVNPAGRLPETIDQL